MKTLPEVLSWYRSVRSRLLNMKRMAGRHWDLLPWDGPLGRDESLQCLEADEVERSVEEALKPIDDLAIFVLFSVFEASVRDILEKQVRPEVQQLRHAMLKKAGIDAMECIREGSFGLLMEAFKSLDHDMVEQVNQVRHYRNWVAHGRRDDHQPAAAVDPISAHDRLKKFLDVIQNSGT